MPTRSELRAQVIELSGGWCEAPACTRPGAELAHLHSIGMGGRRSADRIDNVAWLCADHARISDGEYGSGGRAQFDEFHRRLLGSTDGAGLAYRRAEALSEHVRQARR